MPAVFPGEENNPGFKALRIVRNERKVENAKRVAPTLKEVEATSVLLTL